MFPHRSVLQLSKKVIISCCKVNEYGLFVINVQQSHTFFACFLAAFCLVLKWRIIISSYWPNLHRSATPAGCLNVHLIFHRISRTLNDEFLDDPTKNTICTFLYRELRFVWSWSFNPCQYNIFWVENFYVTYVSSLAMT